MLENELVKPFFCHKTVPRMTKEVPWETVLKTWELSFKMWSTWWWSPTIRSRWPRLTAKKARGMSTKLKSSSKERENHSRYAINDQWRHKMSLGIVHQWRHCFCSCFLVLRVIYTVTKILDTLSKGVTSFKNNSKIFKNYLIQKKHNLKNCLLYF